MQTVYIPGDSLAFKAVVDAHYADNTIELTNVDGKNRWVVTREDGVKYIIRPQECEHEHINS